MVFCLVTLHLWGRIFGNFPELKGLAYADDGSIVSKLSTGLKLMSKLTPVFKEDGNLDFNIGKTKVLAKGPTADHVFERAKHFLDTDPDLADIAHHFTRDMFSTEGIEVLGTPVGTDRFIKTIVAHNCLKIMEDTGKLQALTDGLAHFQLVKFCQNTRTQFISANITIPDSDTVITAQHQYVDRKIAYEILQKGTRGSFRNWSQQDIELATTMLQMPHGMGGYGMTPNVIAQISAKVAMSSRFLGFVGSLSSAEQKLLFPNQNVQDPDTWTLPHLLQLKQEYKKLVEDFNCDIQEFVTVWGGGTCSRQGS
jgi:hypothetical protein